MPRKKETPKKPSAFKHEAYIEGSGSIVDETITDTLKKNYMPYAMSVIISRALPEIDGFKPSHRKLLYMMAEAVMYRLKATKKFREISVRKGIINLPY